MPPEEGKAATTIVTKKKYVGTCLSLFPSSNRLVVWEDTIREHEVWWGDVAVRVITTSLLFSDSDIRVNSTHPTQPVHLKLHQPYESRYILPSLLAPSRPSISAEPEKPGKGRWWESVRGLTRVKVRVPNQNPVSDLTNPASRVGGYRESEFETYEAKKDRDDHPLRKRVEDLLTNTRSYRNHHMEHMEHVEEEVEVNEEEVKKFMKILLSSKLFEHDPNTNHFLVLPEHIVYRPGGGAPFTLKGKYIPNPKANQWAFVSVGRWTRENHHTGLWAFRIWESSSHRHLTQERDNQKGLKVMRIRTKSIPGVIHATVLRLSPWTEEWSLVLILDELVQNSGARGIDL